MASLGVSYGAGASTNQSVIAQPGNQWNQVQRQYISPPTYDDIADAGVGSVLSKMLMNISGDKRPQIMTHVGSNIEPQYVTLFSKQQLESGEVISTSQLFEHYSLTGTDDYLQLLAQVDNTPPGSQITSWQYTFEPGEMNEAAEFDGFTEMRSVHSSLVSYFKKFNKGFEFGLEALESTKGLMFLQAKLKQLRIAYVDTRQFYTLNAVLDASKTTHGLYADHRYNPTRTFNEAVGISVEDWDGFRKNPNFLYNVCSRAQEIVRVRNGDQLNTFIMAPEQALVFNTQTGKSVFYVGGEQGVRRAENLGATVLGEITGENGQTMRIVTVRGNQQVLGIFNRVTETLSFTGTRHNFRDCSVGDRWTAADRKIGLYNPDLDIVEEVHWETAVKHSPLWIKGDKERNPLCGFVKPINEWLTDALYKHMPTDQIENTPFYYKKHAGVLFGKEPEKQHEEDRGRPSMFGKARRMTSGPSTASATSALQDIYNNMLPVRLFGQLRPERDIDVTHFRAAADSLMAGMDDGMAAKWRRAVRIMNKYANMEDTHTVDTNTYRYLQSFIHNGNLYNWSNGGNSAGQIYRRDFVYAGSSGTAPTFNIAEDSAVIPGRADDGTAEGVAIPANFVPSAPFGMLTPLGMQKFVEMNAGDVARWNETRNEISSALSDFEDCINSHIQSAFNMNAFCHAGMASLTNLHGHIPTTLWENFVRAKSGVVPLYVDVVTNDREEAYQVRAQGLGATDHGVAVDAAKILAKNDIITLFSSIKGFTQAENDQFIGALRAADFGRVSLYLAGMQELLPMIDAELAPRVGEFAAMFDDLLAAETAGDPKNMVTLPTMIKRQRDALGKLGVSAKKYERFTQVRAVLQTLIDDIFAAVDKAMKVDDDDTMQVDDIAPVSAGHRSTLYLTTLVVSRAFAESLKAYNRSRGFARGNVAPGIYFYPADEVNPHLPDLDLKSRIDNDSYRTLVAMPHGPRSMFPIFSGRIRQERLRSQGPSVL